MSKTSSALLALAAAGLALLPRLATAEVVNRIVLRVNDRIATLHDYEKRRGQLLTELLQQQLEPAAQQRELEKLGERVYRDLFENMLLLSRADQMEIEITDQQLESVAAQIREDWDIDDEATFLLALQQNGFASVEEFRELMRSNLRMRQVISEEVEAPIEDELKEEHLRRYYRDHPDEFRVPEQVRLREVVVLEENDLTPAERGELAERLRGRIAGGEDLEEVVGPHAESGETSGVIDLGWIRRGELAGDLEAAVFDLPAGSVSEPVAARGGLHVVEVLERKESTVRPFDEVQGRILVRERSRLAQERYPSYLKELEEVSFLRLEPPPEARGFRSAEGESEMPGGPAPTELGEPEEGGPEEPPSGP